jgi:hypothetical protein
MSDDNDEFEEEFERDPNVPDVYIVDSETEALLQSVVGCVQILANSQMNERARDDLHIIALELQDRFGLDDEEFKVQELVHTDPDTGDEELIYKPLGGVFNDEPLDEPLDDADNDPKAEGPAPE